MRMSPCDIEAIFARDAATSLIGIDGMLPWTLSQDLKHFKRVTAGKVVIMGRTTYESICKYSQDGAEPLPGRYKIVLTFNAAHHRGLQPDLRGRNTTFFTPSGTNDDIFEQIMTIADAVSIETSDESMPLAYPNGIVFIGGTMIYNQFLSKCNLIHETRVHKFESLDEFHEMVQQQRSRGVFHKYDYFDASIPPGFTVVDRRVADPIPFVPKIEFITYHRR